MKHYAILLFAFLGVLTDLAGQSKKQAGAMLRRDLEAYRRYTLEMNYDSSFAYMPPGVFKVTPKDSLLKMLNLTKNNGYVQTQITSMEYPSLKKIKIEKAGEYYWAMIPFESSVEMQMNGGFGNLSEVIKILRMAHGEENVTETGNTRLRIRHKDKNLLAFKDPAASRWYLYESDHKEMFKMQPVYEAAIPEEVRKAIK